MPQILCRWEPKSSSLLMERIKEKPGIGKPLHYGFPCFSPPPRAAQSDDWRSSRPWGCDQWKKGKETLVAAATGSLVFCPGPSGLWKRVRMRHCWLCRRERDGSKEGVCFTAETIYRSARDFRQWSWGEQVPEDYPKHPVMPSPKVVKPTLLHRPLSFSVDIAQVSEWRMVLRPDIFGPCGNGGQLWKRKKYP